MQDLRSWRIHDFTCWARFVLIFLLCLFASGNLVSKKKRKTLLSHNNGLYIGRDVVLITQAQIVQACWPTAVAFAVCSCAAFRSRYRRREATHQSAFVAASSFYVSLVWHLKQWSIAPSPCLIINYNFFFFFFFLHGGKIISTSNTHISDWLRHLARSAMTLKGLTGEVENGDHVVTIQCPAGKPSWRSFGCTSNPNDIAEQTYPLW